MKTGWMGCVVVTGLGCAYLCAFSSSLAAQGGRTAVVINEVFYDPDGADTGREFVELFNPGQQAVGLAGWGFDTGNGAYQDRWKTEWTGSLADTVPPGGFFLIGEEGVVPIPEVVTGLDLQNGPDACRLADPSGGVDLVGWGDLTYSEYFEGEPAEDAPSGASIGRDPDGLDSDLNSKDFTTFASPSPGDHNHPPTDLQLRSVSLSRYTPSLSGQLDLVCKLRNAGTERCGAGAVLCAASGSVRDTALVSEDLDPGRTISVVTRISNPGPGIHEVVAWHSFGEDRWNGNDTARTSVVVPPPPVVVNEIMFKPDGQDCEWIELFNHTDRAVSLKGWTLEDSRGRAEPVTDGELAVPAGAFLILVEDEEVFGIIYPGVTGGVVEPCGGWPTLNDVDGPLGYADEVVIRDACGTMVDSVAYRRHWTTPGSSVERIDPEGRSPDPANWSPHFGESTSSPGAFNSVSFHLPRTGSMLTVSPRTFSPNGDGKDDVVAVAVALPGSGLVRLSVFDVNGRLIRRLIDGEVVDSGRVTFWDGRSEDESDAATGAYLLLFEGRMLASGESFRSKLPVVLIRR